MRSIAIMFILIIIGSGNLFSKNSLLPSYNEDSFISSNKLVINANDTVVFDLANATLTANYIDIPIYIISDDPIFALDYALQFNLSKLTFSATIDMVPQDTSYTSLSHFNTTDLFLRYTGGSFLNNLPSGTGLHVTKIRFALSGTCIPIDASDFTNILAILNGIQCSSRVTSLNFTQFIPNAGFTTGPICQNSNIQFTDTSSIASGSMAAWSWNFDNGSTSLIQDPVVIYNTAGAASATLIVTASTGCQDTIINSFNVNVLPSSSFSYSFDCVKDSVFFTNTSTIPAGTIAGSLWNFGDLSSTTSTLTNPSYNYSASELYTVTLASTSDFSCTASNSLIINLTNTVSANFTTNSINNCLGSSISFSDASTYSLNIINSWLWNFGDGNTSTIQNPSYTYSTSGTYSVLLLSTSLEGCKDTVSRVVTIYALPIVQFGINSVTTCIIATTNLADLSITPAGSTYQWSLGNGSTSSLQNPSVTYTNAGEYKVKVVITTSVGCIDSLSKSYTVFFPPPAEAFFSSSILSSAVVSFSNLTTPAKIFFWEFGDYNDSRLENPTHTYANVGTYNVCLTAYDSLDCEYTACKEVYVGLARVVAVPSAFSPNEDNINDVLKVRGGPFSEFRFQILNEWGNVLFSSTSQDNGWDGTFRGDPQPVGAYQYILKCVTLDNQKINRYGIVNLTR